MTSSHRIVRSFGKGNHLKLEVSCVTVTVSLHDGKKEMLIKMVQRLKRNCSRQRTRLDSNWTGKNLLASCLIRLRELKLLPLGFYFSANQSVLSPLVKHAFCAVLLEIFSTGFTRLAISLLFWRHLWTLKCCFFYPPYVWVLNFAHIFVGKNVH